MRPLLPNSVFVTWSKQCTRSSNQARHLGAELLIVHFVTPVSGALGAILRYVASIPSTIRQLRKRRPDVVLTENQPIFLVLSVALYASFARIPYIIDSHSGAFNNPKWRWAIPIYRILARRALINVNTNDVHKGLVESWGGRSLIIADIPIFIDRVEPPAHIPERYLVAITSFGFDEPIVEIIEAARITPHVEFYLTGNYNKLTSEVRERAPRNVHFTGFIAYPQYLGLISHSLGVIVLTTRDNTMQRGAYEALALEVPIITFGFCDSSQVVRRCCVIR